MVWLSAFFRDVKFLLEAVGILSLCEYCSSIRLWIVFRGTHGVQWLFSFVMYNSFLKQLEFWAYLWNYYWSIGLQFVFLGTHGVSWWKLLLESWNLELVQLFLIHWSADWFARHAWCSPSVLHISRGQMLAWGSWNFELVQILIIWIRHCPL